MRFNRADNTSSAKNDELSKEKIPLYNVNLDTLNFYYYDCCYCWITVVAICRQRVCDFARLRVIRISYIYDYDLSIKINATDDYNDGQE